jgi:hypothetical protein
MLRQIPHLQCIAGATLELLTKVTQILDFEISSVATSILNEVLQ